MSLDKMIEAMLKEAIGRGEFDNLPNKGKPIDLSEYFNTPEDVRIAFTMLKNAGILPQEVELLQEIAALKESLAEISEEQARRKLHKEIEEKQLQFNVMMERRQKQRKQG